MFYMVITFNIYWHLHNVYSIPRILKRVIEDVVSLLVVVCFIVI